MPEKFTLQQVLRNGPAIDGDERAGFAGAATVDGARYQFFTSSAFTNDQYRSVRGRYLLDRAEHSLHLRAGTDNFVESFGLAACHQFATTTLQLLYMDGAVQYHFQFAHVYGLAEEIVSSQTYRLHAVLFFVLPRDHDYLQERIRLQHIREGHKSFTGVSRRRRKPKIQSHRMRLGTLEGFECRLPVLGQYYFIVLRKSPFHLGSQFVVIINN